MKRSEMINKILEYEIPKLPKKYKKIIELKLLNKVLVGAKNE